MPQEKRIKAVQIPDGAPLPASPEELAQALFKSADRKLENDMADEAYGSDAPVRKKGRGKK